MNTDSKHPRANTRLAWVGFALVLAASIAMALVPKPNAQTRLASIAKQGLGFVGVELPFSPAELEFLGQATAVKRRYQSGDTRLVMIAIDGTDNRHVIHDPTFCYRGAGFRVDEGEQFPLLNGQGQILKLKKGQEQLRIAYWFSDGESRFTSFYEYIYRSALARLSFGKIWQPPVMVTVHVENNSEFDWGNEATNFPFLDSI